MAEKKTIAAVAAGVIIAGGVIAIAYFATRPKTHTDIMMVKQPVATPDKRQRSAIQTPGLNIGKATIIAPSDKSIVSIIVLKKQSPSAGLTGVPWVAKWEAPNGQWLSGTYTADSLPIGNYSIEYHYGVDWKTISGAFGRKEFSISPINLNPTITLEG